MKLEKQYNVKHDCDDDGGDYLGCISVGIIRKIGGVWMFDGNGEAILHPACVSGIAKKLTKLNGKRNGK